MLISCKPMIYTNNSKLRSIDIQGFDNKYWKQFDIFDMALFTRAQHLCTFNIVAPVIYHLLPNVWKASYTISISIFVDVPYWLLYSTNKFISCVVPGPSQWFFHFGKEIIIAWAHIRWVRWMFQNLPLSAAQEVHDISSHEKWWGSVNAFSWVLDKGGPAETWGSRQHLQSIMMVQYYHNNRAGLRNFGATCKA